eukprot:c12542_g1_i3.p1 GENE.c12542_g1_i3~~c12542_g1_i3.p1  ORF type:complete len:194 (-),score=41.53 c12542_g1_i3:18-599(-)
MCQGNKCELTTSPNEDQLPRSCCLTGHVDNYSSHSHSHHVDADDVVVVDNVDDVDAPLNPQHMSDDVGFGDGVGNGVGCDGYEADDDEGCFAATLHQSIFPAEVSNLPFGGYIESGDIDQFLNLTSSDDDAFDLTSSFLQSLFVVCFFFALVLCFELFVIACPCVSFSFTFVTVDLILSFVLSVCSRFQDSIN